MKMRASFVVLAPALAMLWGGAALAQGTGDAQAGEKVFNRCKACHTIEAGGANRVGPNLHGVVGRKAGAVEGYNYSDALKKANVTWDEQALSQYLTDPKGFIPGNKMAFPGIKDQQDIANVIAYLKQQS